MFVRGPGLAREHEGGNARSTRGKAREHEGDALDALFSVLTLYAS